MHSDFAHEGIYTLICSCFLYTFEFKIIVNESNTTVMLSYLYKTCTLNTFTTAAGLASTLYWIIIPLKLSFVFPTKGQKGVSSPVDPSRFFSFQLLTGLDPFPLNCHMTVFSETSELGLYQACRTTIWPLITSISRLGVSTTWVSPGLMRESKKNILSNFLNFSKLNLCLKKTLKVLKMTNRTSRCSDCLEKNNKNHTAILNKNWTEKKLIKLIY